MKPVGIEEYQLDFFKREGFVRKRCRKCGSYFWALNPDQEFCNDAPCVKYALWTTPSRSGVSSVADARRLFINFFNRRGHAIVRPRPVVARWREDLYLTIASIVVFQPHVTKGVAEPPANPLVIVQPCVRLEDIDNVGITLGRHLTSFEMGGHHAFNYPGRRVYWREETVEYAFEFFSKELGIPRDSITFKESWWEGGGNAGPSFEVSVAGLELATLVFMKYEVSDGGYRETPVKTVDTGYGMERIAWFLSKAPTAFHAIYGNLVDEFHKLLGIEKLDEKVLKAIAVYAGLIDPEEPQTIDNALKSVASEVSIGFSELKRAFEQEVAVLALLDHTKTLSLMLADGIVPSNAGEGYLARLVIRRSLRLMRKVGAEVSLSDLVARQIDYWSRDYYPQLRENADYILRMVEMEEKKYKQTLARGAKIVERLIERRKALRLEDLVELYDSHGIPPDLVKEVAKEKGIHVEVPHNFYSLVAARHTIEIVGHARREHVDEELTKWASKYPATRLLFHEDPYLRTFRAKVLGVLGRYLILDQTAFYPTGGGQVHDEGTLRACGTAYKVVDVVKVGDVVVHVLDRAFDDGCREVEGVIDWDRRYRIMRHHTAVHVLLGALRRLYGKHIWQAGAEKTPSKARLDVTHYETPSPEEVRKIEQMVNQVVRLRLPIRTRILKKFEAEETYGMPIYQGGAPLESKLRIVEIENWDAQACFGTHLANTSEIGAIKIVNVEKIQDGVVRFEIVAGDVLVDYASSLEDRISVVASYIGGDPSSIEARARKVAEEHAKTLELMRRYRAFALKTIQQQLRVRNVEGVKLYVYEDEIGDRALITELMRRVTSEPKSVVLVISKDVDTLRLEVASSRDLGVDLRHLAKIMASSGFKGGGRHTYVALVYQGRPLSAETVVDYVVKALTELVRGIKS